MTETTQRNGMKSFMLLWVAQLISLVGSGLTAFAMSVWVYERNGSATQFMLIFLFTTIPGLILAPFAGAVVDRSDRRRVMLISDVVAGLSTLALAALFFTDRLAPWHIYTVITIRSIANAFLWPAFTAVTPLLVPKRHLSRTGGLLQFAEASSQLIAPLLGGFLYVAIQVSGVLLIDAVTFVFSFVTLLLIRIPQAETTAAGAAGRGSLWQEMVYGWKYLVRQAPLRALLLFMIATRFVLGVVLVLATPLALNFTSVTMLGILQSVGGVGALIGSVLMSVWAGPKRRTTTLFAAELIGGICLLIVGLSQSVLLFGVIIFIYYVRYPISLTSSYAIWVSKIPVDLQGRVFAVVRAVAFSALPLAYLMAGPAVDYFFNPLFAVGGALDGTLLGQVIGIGPGRGIPFVFVLMGLLAIVLTIGGLLYRPLRLLEDLVPDAVADTPASDNAGTDADAPVPGGERPDAGASGVQPSLATATRE